MKSLLGDTTKLFWPKNKSFWVNEFRFHRYVKKSAVQTNMFFTPWEQKTHQSFPNILLWMCYWEAQIVISSTHGLAACLSWDGWLSWADCFGQEQLHPFCLTGHSEVETFRMFRDTRTQHGELPLSENVSIWLKYLHGQPSKILILNSSDDKLTLQLFYYKNSI